MTYGGGNMGVLEKIFGGKKDRTEEIAEVPACPHAVLMPRWDNAADMGHEDRATSFVCEGCQAVFTGEEAQLLRETSIADRLVYQEEAREA
jgi:hypothetical protein